MRNTLRTSPLHDSCNQHRADAAALYSRRYHHIYDQHIQTVSDRASHPHRPPVLIMGHDCEQ